ncbi:Y-family DNA polymerase [Rhodobacter capsulatus]|uniref:Y-family DNA polymerase n=1 Tax=Rhodobacter capsulatus TaxID=1061 RepID=UPI0040291CC0
MCADIRARLERAGITAQLGRGDSRGAAWARGHFGDPAAEADLLALPVAALRLDPDTVTGLQRLGLRRIGDLAASPRAPLARRFGPDLLTRLDQALGHSPEPVTPATEPPRFATRMTLPEPIGLESDVMAGLTRLLEPLCAKLSAHQAGARQLVLTLRRVDQASQQVELRLAAPMRDPARILPLFVRGLAGVDAGFGIDQLRLEATRVEPLAPRAAGHDPGRQPRPAGRPAHKAGHPGRA